MIHMAVDYCKCHMIPADRCVEVNELIARGVPPDELTYEVFIPPLEGEGDAFT